MFRDSLRTSVAALLFTAVALVTSGCGLGVTATSANDLPQSLTSAGLSGVTHGGGYPISGATVTAWYPGVSGYGAAANKLTSTTTGDGTNGTTLGAWSMPAFTCPDANMPVYVTSTGGNPGLSSGTNSYAALAAYVGPCGTAATRTGLIVDEVTTVGLAFATAQFSGASQAGGKASGAVGATAIGSVSGTTLTNGGNIGAPIGTVSGGTLTVTNSQVYTNLKNAFATVNNLVNVGTGLAGPVTTGNITNDAIGPYTTTNKINTMADILASCVQSDGVTADGSTCASLASSTTGVTPTIGTTALTAPSDTFQMAQYMALSPTTNIASVYANVTAKNFFQPTATSAPFDWTLAITYNGLSTGSVGGSTFYDLASVAVDAKGQVWVAGSTLAGIYGLSPLGVPLNSGSAYLSGSDYSGANGLMIDASGNVWAANSGSASNSVVKFNPTSPVTSASYTQYPESVSCGPSGLTLDENLDFLFTCVKQTTSGDIYPLNGLMNSGSTTSPTYPANPTTVGSAATALASGTEIFQIASDTSGNIWVPILNTDDAVIELQPTPSTGEPTSYADGSTYTGNVASTGGGVGIDHSGQIWFNAAASLSKLNGSTVTTYAGSGTTGAGQSNSHFMAIDGAGDIWIANSSAYVVGSTASTEVKYPTVSEFNNSGKPITPPTLPAASPYTQPGGYAHNFGLPEYLAIDGSGNVWVPNYQPAEPVTSWSVAANNVVTLNGTFTGFSTSSFATVYGFTSTAGSALNGISIGNLTTASATQIVGTAATSATLATGSNTENGLIMINSGYGTNVTEIVGAAVPVYTPLGTAPLNNKLGVLP